MQDAGLIVSDYYLHYCRFKVNIISEEFCVTLAERAKKAAERLLVSACTPCVVQSLQRMPPRRS